LNGKPVHSRGRFTVRRHGTSQSAVGRETCIILESIIRRCCWGEALHLAPPLNLNIVHLNTFGRHLIFDFQECLFDFQSHLHALTSTTPFLSSLDVFQSFTMVRIPRTLISFGSGLAFLDRTRVSSESLSSITPDNIGGDRT
jgi:hypothetical protein